MIWEETMPRLKDLYQADLQGLHISGLKTTKTEMQKVMFVFVTQGF